MHVFHDDLLPLYYTMKLYFGGGGKAEGGRREGDGGGREEAVQNASSNGRLFLADNWPNVTEEINSLYSLLTPNQKVLTTDWMLQLHLQHSVDAVCFSDALIGP